ncbi:MAG: efflux RND transporter periplasmic adaptor subunit [Saprospiraceae bacterium]|nr:efflux RND transporter periplasmic adaptor subunit [Saprospiraceae bacterium]
MKSIIKMLSISLAAILAFSCGNTKKEDVSQQSETRNTPTVLVSNPQTHPFSANLQITGTAKPNQTVKLFAMTSGFLVKLSADIGDFVKEGQTLAVLENPELLRDKQRLEATFNEKRLLFERLKNTPELSQTGADLLGKKAVYERLKSVYEKTPQLTTIADVEQAKAAYESLKALSVVELEKAEAEYHSLQAQFNSNQQQINYLTIKAPFPGIIVNRLADKGAVVQSGLNNANTMPLFELQSIQPVRLQIDVPESDAVLIEKGTKVAVSFPELPNGKYTATVSRIAYSLDEMTKTMKAEVDLPNRDLKIRTGMYAKVDIQRSGHKEVLSVSNDAIGNIKGQSFVYVVRDGVAKKVDVKTGIRDDKFTEILNADIKTTDAIVVKGKEFCSDGAAVQTKSSTNQ